MNSVRFLTIVVLAFGLPATPIVGQESTPQIIKLQGFLSDKSGGTPVPANGTFPMTFVLYDAELGGALVSSTGPASVTANDGLYEVELPFPASAFDGADRYIGITVDGETLSPRIRVVSAPFAYVADKLDGFEGAELDESADIQHVETTLRSEVTNLQGQIDDLVTTGGNTLDEAYDQGDAGHRSLPQKEKCVALLPDRSRVSCR